VVIEDREELLHLLVDGEISTLLEDLLVGGCEWHEAFEGVDIAVLV
jgi:hypothetical protein